jgi:hypothetical protein
MCFINKYTQGGALMKIAETPQYRRLKICIVKNLSSLSKKVQSGNSKIQSQTRTTQWRQHTGQACSRTAIEVLWPPSQNWARVLMLPISLNFYKQCQPTEKIGLIALQRTTHKRIRVHPINYLPAHQSGGG